MIAVLMCVLAACSTKDWFDSGDGHHIGNDSTGTGGHDSTSTGNDSTGTGGTDSTGTVGGDSTIVGLDSLRVGILLEPTPEATGSITIQIINDSNRVVAQRTIGVDSITWQAPVITPYNSAYSNSFTYFQFAGKFPSIKHEKSRMRVKWNSSNTHDNAVYWYSSRGDSDVYPAGSSSLGSTIDFAMDAYYHEFPYNGSFLFVSTRDLNAEEKATLKRRKLSQDWSWQEFVLN